MSYLPVAKSSTITVYLGTVYGCTMTAGSAAISSSGLSSADAGRVCTVIGAGPNTGDPYTGSMLKATYNGSGSLSVAASISVSPNNNLTVYRPIPTTSPNYVVQNPGQSYNASLTQKASYSFSVFSEDGSLQPLRGQPVWVHDTNPDNQGGPNPGDIFGGYIDKVTRKNTPGSKAVLTTCDCIDWAGVLTRRLVGSYLSTYSGKTLAQLSEALVYGHGGSEGFVVNSVTGPSGLSASYDYSSSVAAAIDDACARAYSSGNSYYWFVDPWKIVHVVAQNTTAAAWSTITNMLIDVEQIVDGSKRANRVYASGNELTGPLYETVPCGSSSLTVSVSQPIGSEPIITVGGVPQSVGALNIDTGKDWYWSQGSGTLTRTTSGSAVTLAVTYQGIVPAQGWSQYNTGVDAAASVEGGTGYYDLNLSLSQVSQTGDVQALAETEAKTYSDNPAAVTLKGYRGGLHVADSFPLLYAPFGINGTYLIDQVTMETQDNLALWTYHMVYGPLIGDWRDPFVSLVGGGTQVGGSGGSSSGVPGPPGPPGPSATPPDDVISIGTITYSWVVISA